MDPEITTDTPVPSDPPERRRRRSLPNQALRAIKAAHSAERTLLQRFADRLTRIAASATFFVAHILWFGIWILWNTDAFGFAPFDPYPFGLLTMIVSLEAIFLSMFVLMAQSRESAIAELREEVTLQVNLRMEQEVTKTLQLVAGLYTRQGHQLGADPELQAMLEPLDAEGIERELMSQIQEAVQGRKRAP